MAEMSEKPDDKESSTDESPVPAKGQRFGFDLGNPIERESAAFSWLIVVIIAAISVGLVGKLISPLAAVIWVVILLGIVSVPIFRGLVHQLGSPDDDE
jgi:hypothetical protein